MDYACEELRTLDRGDGDLVGSICSPWIKHWLSAARTPQNEIASLARIQQCIEHVRLIRLSM
jgi:hypothetical protein